jgi:hypothetical protein
MKKALIIASVSTTLWMLSSIPQAAYARPSDATATAATTNEQQFKSRRNGNGGDTHDVDTRTATDINQKTLKKKKIDIKQREQFASDTIRRFNNHISNNIEGNEQAENDFNIRFHNRQREKKQRLDEIHIEVSEKLEAHRSGRNLLSTEELDTYTKKKTAIERKRKSLNEETPERYIERMKRHEEKMLKKIDRKERRKEERFQKMMMDASGEL